MEYEVNLHVRKGRGSVDSQFQFIVNTQVSVTPYLREVYEKLLTAKESNKILDQTELVCDASDLQSLLSPVYARSRSPISLGSEGDYDEELADAVSRSTPVLASRHWRERLASSLAPSTTGNLFGRRARFSSLVGERAFGGSVGFALRKAARLAQGGVDAMLTSPDRYVSTGGSGSTLRVAAAASFSPERRLALAAARSMPVHQQAPSTPEHQ